MILDILTQRFNTKHWDRDKPISEETLTYITDCLHKAPSKMSLVNYKVIIVTDSETGLEFKKWLFYDHTWNHNGDRAPVDSPNDGQRDYNGQYLAPILLVWLNPINTHTEGIVDGQRVNFPDFMMRQNNIFISNAVAVLAAGEQGLNTGFGSCHDPEEVALKLGFKDYSCPIMLGVGYAADMTVQVKNDDWLISVVDPNETNKILGTCLVNLPSSYEKPNRLLRPAKENMILIL
jgi:hypothetical protein